MIWREIDPFASLVRATREPVTFAFLWRLSAYLLLLSSLLVFLFCGMGRAAHADPLPISCPTPNEPCKVLILTPNDEQMLVKQGGILDTASRASYLDLG